MKSIKLFFKYEHESVYIVVLMRKTHNTVKINDPNYKIKICTEK